MNASTMKTATVNTVKKAAEKSLLGTAILSHGIAKVFNTIEEKSFDNAVMLRANRKEISPDVAAAEITQSYNATLENIDLKYAKLKGILSQKKIQQEKTEGVKNWEPKIV